MALLSLSNAQMINNIMDLQLNQTSRIPSNISVFAKNMTVYYAVAHLTPQMLINHTFVDIREVCFSYNSYSILFICVYHGDVRAVLQGSNREI